MSPMTAPTDRCINAPRASMHALLTGSPSSGKPHAQSYTFRRAEHGERADKTDKWARTAFQQPCQRVGLAP